MAVQRLGPVRNVTLYLPKILTFSDRKEPPPSYQDAVSDYNSKPSDVLPGDDDQALKPHAQYLEDKKSNTLGASSSGFGQQSEEGSSVLEQRGALRATIHMNDKNVAQSTSSSVRPEDVAEAGQENLSVSLRHVRT